MRTIMWTIYIVVVTLKKLQVTITNIRIGREFERAQELQKCDT